jgi:Zn-dependent metalloprotease
MKTKLVHIVLLTLLILILGVEGNAQFKKVNKIAPPSNQNSLVAVKQTANNIAEKIKEIIQKNGLSSIQDKSSSFSKQNVNISNYKIHNFDLKSGDQVKEVIYDENLGTPVFAKFSVPLNKIHNSVSVDDFVKNSKDFLLRNKELIKIKNPDSEFELKNHFRDDLGLSHLKFTQKYLGLEVWGKEIVVHMDINGNVVSLNGRFIPTPSFISSLTEKISEGEALRITLNSTGITNTEVSNDIKFLTGYEKPVVRKIIWCDELQIPHLAWFVEVRKGLFQDWYYFLDAIDGTVLNFYNNVTYDGAATGTGTDLNGVSRTFGTYQIGSNYYMIDASQPMFDAANSQLPNNPKGAIVTLNLSYKDLSSENPIYYFTSTTNTWSDPAAISAHYNTTASYKFYNDELNRNSIDNNGMTIYSIVHATEGNQPMDNAFWTGKVMCFGDGATAFKPLAGALDVVAHEMSHGVTQYSANLEYQGQSGALNESMSDVFGAMVDNVNWTLGELIVKDYSLFPSGALRDMENPHNGGTPGSPSWQPANMSEFVNTTQDNGGVHINSGIPNRVFYLAATSIGRSNAARIWYRALTVYLTRNSKFIDARIATVNAAGDIFGATSNEVTQVKNAWDEVGVTDGTGTTPPPPSSITGDNWILMTNTDPLDYNSIYMAKPTITSNSDFYALSTTPVFNKPAVSDATGLVMFIDKQYNLRSLNANPGDPSETVVDNSGVWWSVAVGPGLNSLALTSVYSDTSIYYFDLVNNISIQFKIVTPSYDAPDAKTALYADALSFDPTGRFLLFDAYNEIKNSDGSTLGFWTINILDISTGQMGSVFPPLPAGIDIGNPSWSKTSSTHFVFDFFDETSKECYVRAADFNTNSVGFIAGPLSVIGYPTYSGDDKTVAYHTTAYYQSPLYDAINKIALKDNMIESSGSPQDYVIAATYPYWFVIGNRVSDANDGNNNNIPASFGLSQNYPNPFNPSTKISWQSPVGSHQTLKVYDVLGNEVATLIDEYKPAGRYDVEFNARQLSSGIYFYQLKAGSFVETKKMILLK